MRWLTTEEQDHGVRARFPGFRCDFLARWSAQWTGDLTPDRQRYQVRVRFIPGGEARGIVFVPAGPNVFLLDPPARRRPDAPDERVPHIYSEGPPAHLCLWLPSSGEWSPTNPIAETIIPWASEWLFFYELWHATSVWYGSGAHPPRTA